jgi:serine protease Do
MDGGDMAISPFRGKGGWSYDGMNPNGERAFLGVTSLRPENGPAGAKVGEVSAGSAAEKAGIKEGDLITKVDEIVIDGPEDLARAISKYKPEDKVTLTLTRDGKEQKATATLGRMKNTIYRYKGPEGQDFNFDFRDMVPPNMYKRYDFDGNSGARLGIRAQDTEDGKGVKVLSVDEESAAAKVGIKTGDIITRFDGTEVNSASALAQKAREGRTKPSVHVTVIRSGKTLDFDIKVPRKLRTADL